MFVLEDFFFFFHNPAKKYQELFSSVKKILDLRKKGFSYVVILWDTLQIFLLMLVVIYAFKFCFFFFFAFLS